MGTLTIRDPRALLRAALVLAVIVALFALAAPPAFGQFGGFTWTLAGSTQGSGSQTPTGLHVVGPDGIGCTDGSTTQFETLIPGPGTISVDVDFVNLDSWVIAQGHAIFDSPCVLVDGVMTQPPSAPCCPNGWPSGPYHFDVPVQGGQVLGLGVWAADCAEGPGIADFSGLVFTPTEQLVYPVAIDVHERFQVHGGQSSDFGYDVAGLGDVNGDGRGDIVTIAPGPDLAPQGLVQYLSGNDGTPLQTLFGDFNKALTVAGAGDFNNDGTPDAIIGLPGKNANGKTNAGRAEVRSGLDGALLYALEGTLASGFLGTSVAPAPATWTATARTT
jgi:hypothetical protein